MSALKGVIVSGFIAVLILLQFLPSEVQSTGTRDSGMLWCVNLHPEAPDASYNLSLADDALSYIVDLGAKMVRTDIPWDVVEPQNDSWNQTAINFFNEYINLTVQKGLDIIAILYRPPSWAIDLYNSNKTAFFQEYYEYCKKISHLYGDRIHYYQAWNEANHMNDPIAAEDDYLLYKYAHSAISSEDDDFEVIVNVFCDLSGWEDALTDWLSKANESIDIIGIDHYPGTWTLSGYDDWYPLDALINHISTPGDPCYGKKGAVLETGFSTYSSPFHDEDDQREFINTALPIIREKVTSYNQNHTNKIIIGNWYELIDYNSGGGINPEDHFGILYTNRTKKPAYDDLKYQISLFYGNVNELPKILIVIPPLIAITSSFIRNPKHRGERNRF